MALAEVVDGYCLRALASFAAVGQVYLRPHRVGVTVPVLQLISAALTKHARQDF